MIEQEVAWQPRTDEHIGKFIVGRVLPHVLIVSYLLYFLSRSVSTIHLWLWLFIPVYFVTTFAHTFVAVRRIRFLVHIAMNVGVTIVIYLTAVLLAPHSEAGFYIARTLAAFAVLLLWFSAVNNYWFLLSRWYYIVELALVNALWITMIVSRLEASITTILALSFPVLAYSLYILFSDYTLGRRLDRHGRRKLFVRYIIALFVLLLGALIGYIAGFGTSTSSRSRSYSLLSSKNDRFVVQDRAKLEEEFKIPLDSKELVFVAHIDPVIVDNKSYDIGYYLKFHSLYNYDPARMEFNSTADEMEDPGFRVRSVPLEKTRQDPAHLTVDLNGRDIVPGYSLRVDGKTTIYNVKLSTEQNFGHNLTYRFVSYVTKDSIAVADKVFPLLGIHSLYSKISILNLIPIGTAGELFQYDFNKLVLDRIRRYSDVDQVPLSFAQQYLNTTGLEPDILDTARKLVRGCTRTTDKIEAIIRFFTRTAADGRPLFTYDLKPGKSPDPEESLLHYFLFRNHRGYCTYYATAAALMFRIAGIPARVAVGFVPGESSQQNPGWYYVYSLQAHAWTEIYLGSSLGWIDLDLTPTGQNSDAPPPPTPTPPTPPLPLDVQYSLTGTVIKTGDDLACIGSTLSRKSEEQDEMACPQVKGTRVALVFDSSMDTQVGISDARRTVTEVVRTLRSGDSIMATGKESSNPGLANCNVDRFVFYKIAPFSRSARDSMQKKPQQADGPRWWENPWLYAGFALFMVLGVLLTPRIHLALLRMTIRSTSFEPRRLSCARRWIFLKLHMHRIITGAETDSEYALRLETDQRLPLHDFFEQYLRCRYFGIVEGSYRLLCEQSLARVTDSVRKNIGLARRLVQACNVWEYIRFINRGKTA